MKKIILTLVLIFGVVICSAPIMAAESNSDGIVLGLFDDLVSHQMNITNLQINKIIHSHTDVNGNTKNHTTYDFSFTVNDDVSDLHSINLTFFDANNSYIGSTQSFFEAKGDFKIDLPNETDIKTVNVTVYDKSHNIVFNNTTSNFHVDNDVTVDKAPEPQPSSSSSASDSGVTYVASSKSGKFHTPGCEWAQKIASSNKVVFHSREDAINSGYSPCKVCSP